MKFHSIFCDILDCSNEQEVFLYLKNSFVDSVNVWDYFVNWKKVLQNAKSIEIDLNLLNYLIGKDNIEDEFCFLLKQYPRITSVIPILIACRNLDFKILTDYTEENLAYKYFDFKVTNNLTEDQVNRILEFVRKTGLLDLFKNKVIKSIPDYILGIEVGLDSNARKNRSGTTMETIGKYKSLYDFIASQKHKFIWITDGFGWQSALRPLEETFHYIDYILNLKMITSGLLASIISHKL